MKTFKRITNQTAERDRVIAGMAAAPNRRATAAELRAAGAKLDEHFDQVLRAHASFIRRLSNPAARSEAEGLRDGVLPLREALREAYRVCAEMAAELEAKS